MGIYLIVYIGSLLNLMVHVYVREEMDVMLEQTSRVYSIIINEFLQS